MRQTWTVSFLLAEITLFPSGEKARELMDPEGPAKVRKSAPSATRHNRMSPVGDLPDFGSSWLLPEINVEPSGEKASDNTAFVCPVSARSKLPVAVCHKRILLSRDPAPEARICPSGLNATELT